MRVLSLNANGIRAAARKGFFDWLPQSGADIVCIQETKAQIEQLADPVFHPDGYHSAYVDAEKRGYSGVAIYSRVRPDAVITHLGFEEADQEGRYVEMRFGNLSVASLYLPSGSSGDHRQESKWRFLDFFLPWLAERAREGRQWLICGDWNIAHREIDLKNWKPNQKNSGFLPEERAFLDRVFGELGLVDVFRSLDPRPEQYTWWSNRGQAWAKNVGWRIDYQIATPALAATARDPVIYKEQRFSDHAPFWIDYDHALDSVRDTTETAAAG
ncbi:Exodeoxyribonuclease III [Thioalkalivibrio nitratireducens DSM 14787]|uniref:Exodeoxyribonuclease III n=1 Tax=Thioalkalivibrio nitratireducens (strain DSM 14787 / UNIQEM 213 / ALEN2) TaxID=1255043 RepID=L0E2C6_THIND|nr:exodeoxyribonuclease III [Thioalkalivibrio nitratireducens]AGA35387.1 Exodeoxyribonuclease III [Thioalkalivibrio nitratireducens DSM 14787]